MTTRTLIVITFLTLAFAAPAGAQEKAPGPIAVGAKVGVVLPQIATELATTWGTELEGSFRVFGHISVFATLGYTSPRCPARRCRTRASGAPTTAPRRSVS